MQIYLKMNKKLEMLTDGEKIGTQGVLISTANPQLFPTGKHFSSSVLDFLVVTIIAKQQASSCFINFTNITRCPPTVTEGSVTPPAPLPAGTWPFLAAAF